MTPRSQDNLNLTWNIVGKSTLAALAAWAAWEFREMRVAVYSGQTATAVLENKVENIDNRVNVIEAKLLKEK